MELVSEITHSMYRVAYPFSLIYASRGDIFSPDRPTKERDTWAGKYEVMNLRCSTLYEDLITLYEKAKDVYSLQEEEKIYDSPCTLVARVTKL